MKSKKLYQKYSGGKHWKMHTSQYAKSFSIFLQNKKFNGLIVDIGCGSGRDVETFTRLGFKSLGIDKSNKEIKLAKNNFPQSNFEVQNAEALKFKNNSVGAFFMINAIHYVDERKAISEILRTLKPRGYFFVHFNMKIIDNKGKLDYSKSSEEILKAVSKFKILKKRFFARTDYFPIKHKHKILELILQKP